MDWGNIIAIVLAGGGVVGMIVQGIMNRRVTRAQAQQIEAQSKSTNVDYAGVIIEQSNKRVDQAFADTERMRQERDMWQTECRGQRKAKQEWRAKYEEAVARTHELELANKDAAAKFKEADWHRCEVNGCAKRIPPRTRESLKDEQK